MIATINADGRVRLSDETHTPPLKRSQVEFYKQEETIIVGRADVELVSWCVVVPSQGEVVD